MTHPFQRRPASHRRAALTVACVLAALPIVLGAVAPPLPAGNDIVDFELAGSVDRAEEILAVWRAGT